MKQHHTIIVLVILFFTGLIVLWWAPRTGVDVDTSDAVLPALVKVPLVEIKRLEIERPESKGEKSEMSPGRIVLERRDEGRWQMVEPIDVAADPSVVETLAQNLKGMRKSLDAGTIHDPPGRFGLAPPRAVVRVFGADTKAPIAALDIGKGIREQLYVRPEGGEGIEVVDPRLLSMLDNPPADWRDKALFHLPSFRVGTLAANGPGRDLKVERDEGHWRLVRPFASVADDDKVEGMVAELTSLQVAKGNEGFVADNIKDKGGDAAKYGLDPPVLEIVLTPAIGGGKPQTLLVGKPVPDEPDLSYARVGNQDDLVLVNAKNFRDLGLDINALRSQKVAEIDPARVEFVRIEAFGRTFDLSRAANGWTQLQPTREEADASAVQGLLKGLAEAQTSAFLDPSQVSRPGIDPPPMTIRVWQAGPRAKPALALESPPKAEPRFVLQVGSHDAVRKMLYARLAGDRSLLTIPDTLIEVLPNNPLAFRDRTVLTLGAAQIARLTIRRGGTAFELVAPNESGTSTHWRMTAPVAAPADEEAVTKVVMLLANLHAESYVTDQIGDGKAFGLHAPTFTATWTLSDSPRAGADQAKAKAKEKEPPKAAAETGTLRVGAKLPRKDLWFANIEGSPIVFTLSKAVLEPFEGEFHTHRVLAFRAGAARRLALRWPGRTLSFRPQENPSGKGVRWVPEEGVDASGFDVSRVGPLVGVLSKLDTPKFLQYRGPLSPETGLDAPLLEIEVQLGDDRGTRRLRLGRSTDEETLATDAEGDSGPVFLLTGPAWHDLIEHPPGKKGDELPEDVFAPEPGKPSEQSKIQSP
jgi:hypothetical protein